MKNDTSVTNLWQNTFCALTACAALSGTAVAANHTSGWDGSLNIGFKHSTGTTNSNDINASLTLEHNKNFRASQPIRHTLNIATDTEKTKSEDGTETTTQDKDTASYQLGYFLDQQSHIEGTLSYLHDIDLKIDEGKFASVEYIRNVLTEPAHQLQLGVGVAYLDIAYTDTQPEIQEVGGQVSYNYTGKLAEDFSLNHKGLLQATSDIRYTSLDTGISYALTDNTSLSLNHHFSTLSNDTGNGDDEKNSTVNLTIGVKF
ncbi:MAG: DUF481 domain-containing protein [Pseudomonadota bacterium]